MRPRQNTLNAAPLRRLEELCSIKDEWEDIYNSNNHRVPWLSFEFIALWYKCFSSPEQVRVYRVTDGKKTIGFLPLIMCLENSIRILNGLNNSHFLHNCPLVREGCEALFQELMLAELLRDQNNWDVFEYRFSYSMCRFPGLFPEDLLNSANVAWEREIQPTYLIRLRESLEEYLEGDLTSKFRMHLRRYAKRLERAGSHSLKHYQGAEAVSYWPEMLRIEDAGWKGQANTSLKSLPANFKNYYEGFIRVLAAQDVLHLYFLELNGQAIASFFGYVEGSTLHVSKIGYDEEFGRFSPSNVLWINIIEDLITNSSGIERIHMFPWDYGYKHRYANEEAWCLDTKFYSHTPRATAARLVSSMKSTLRPYLRRGDSTDT